jgi:DNA-binding XRE family transcriptional regulator
MTATQFKRHRLTHYGTQARMAAALGVTRGAVAMWEHGRRPIPGIVIKLLECLEMSTKIWEVKDGFLTCCHPIRFRLDGHEPTQTEGHLLQPGERVQLSKSAIGCLRVKVIQR